MKKLILLFITSTIVALPFLGGCTNETPRTREARAKAELAAVEAYKISVEGEAYAIKRQADAESYAIRQEANEQMAITQQWIAERMAILRQEQRDSALMRMLVWASMIAAFSMPMQFAFMVWVYMTQKNKDAMSEREFYKAVIAMQRGKDR